MQIIKYPTNATIARSLYVIVCCFVLGLLAVMLRPVDEFSDTGWITTGYIDTYGNDENARDLQMRTKQLFDNLSNLDMKELYEAKIQKDICLVIVCFGLPPEKVRAALDVVISRRANEEAQRVARQNNEIAQKGAIFAYVSLLISVCALFVGGANFLWK